MLSMFPHAGGAWKCIEQVEHSLSGKHQFFSIFSESRHMNMQRDDINLKNIMIKQFNFIIITDYEILVQYFPFFANT